jgi:hypothetical protein
MGRREGGRGRAVGSGVASGVVCVGLAGLRMLENHLWTAEAGDKSCGCGVVVAVVVSEFLRLCFADLERISPLKLSTALFLFQQ